MRVVTVRALNRAPSASGGCQSPGNGTANARMCRTSNADTGIAVACAIANVRRGGDVTGRLTSAARQRGETARMRVVTVRALNRAPMASGGCQSPGNSTANARLCRASNADTGIAVACAIANVCRGGVLPAD
jgi:hypothetical protein